MKVGVGKRRPGFVPTKNVVTEDVMRNVMMGIGLVACAALLPVQPATAAKSKMGCEIGSEVWNASTGKCEPGKPKYTKRAAGSVKKKAPAKN
jgi:hypothetical protein